MLSPPTTVALDKLIQNSPWKDFASNTNYAFDPYGETEEKTITTTTNVTNATKDKSRSRHSNNNNNNNNNTNSQQTSLAMSHSPTSKSQAYYEGANGGHSNANNSRPRSAYVDGNTQEYRSNGRMTQRNTQSQSVLNDNGAQQYDRYEERERHREHRERDRSADRQAINAYGRGSYAERAYSLPRQQHQQQHSNLQPSGYYTQDRRANRGAANEERRHPYREGSRTREDPRLSASGGADTPDFYFMPSQRKYSGEVVRVYVDYNKDPKN